MTFSADINPVTQTVNVWWHVGMIIVSEEMTKARFTAFIAELPNTMRVGYYSLPTSPHLKHFTIRTRRDVIEYFQNILSQIR